MNSHCLEFHNSLKVFILLNLLKIHNGILQCRIWQTFPLKGQIVNCLIFVSHMVSVTTSQLCCCSTKTTIDNRWMNENVCDSIQLYKNRLQGRFNTRVIVCWLLIWWEEFNWNLIMALSLFTGYSWERYLIYISVVFLICKIGIIKPTSQDCYGG